MICRFYEKWHHTVSTFFFLTEYCCSVFKSCLTLCDPMDCGMPGFPVLHYLLEFAEIHVHWLVKLSNHLILCPPLLLLPSKYMNWIHFGDISMALHLDLPYSSSLLPHILNVWLKKKKKVLFSCSPIDGYYGYWQFCFYKQGCNNLAWTRLSQMMRTLPASWGKLWERSSVLAPLVCFRPADTATVGAQKPRGVGGRDFTPPHAQGAGTPTRTSATLCREQALCCA